MADRETVSRIAKILARAGSDNENEAQAALEGAYKRMKRDGVTLSELLSLPLQELYQEALVKLVGVIVAEQGDLSPASKRALYAEYMRLVVMKFSGGTSGESQSNEGNQQNDRSREEEARRYEEARRRQESERSRSSEGSNHDENTFKRKNVNPSETWTARTFQVGRFTFSFSPAAFFSALQQLFGRGSFAWNAFRDPLRAFRLCAASLLFGFGLAAAVLLVAAVLHTVTGTGPLWDIRLKNAFSFLAAVGFLLKANLLYREGWFSR